VLLFRWGHKTQRERSQTQQERERGLEREIEKGREWDRNYKPKRGSDARGGCLLRAMSVSMLPEQQHYNPSDSLAP